MIFLVKVLIQLSGYVKVVQVYLAMNRFRLTTTDVIDR